MNFVIIPRHAQHDDARAFVPSIRYIDWTDADREEVVNEVCNNMQISRGVLEHADSQLQVLVHNKLSCHNGPHTFTPEEFERMRERLKAAIREVTEAMRLILNT